MSDYYDGNNKEEDRLVKLSDKVQEWWDNLDYEIQVELIEVEYPDDSNMMEVSERWNGLSWNDKVYIYIDFNEQDEYMSEDELYDGGVMSNYNDNNEKEEW